VGLCTTDLVNARSLLEKREEGIKLDRNAARDSPLAVSFSAACRRKCATRPSSSKRAAWLSIDINVGCPVKVCKVGGGSAMMTELDNLRARQRHGGRREDSRHRQDAAWLGRRESHRADLARALEAVGVAAIFVTAARANRALAAR
jgi:hypothetical protein